MNNTLLPFLFSRVLGEWLIHYDWAVQNLDLLHRMETSQEKPEGFGMTLSLMDSSGNICASVDQKGTVSGGSKPKGKLFATVGYVGPVYKYGYWGGSKIIGETLKALAADDSVSGVRLILDSPGGAVSGTRELYQAIANYPKPILAVVDGLMASAAYYLGAGSDRIVATQPTDMIGSIGTMATYADIAGYFRKIGLQVHEIYAPGSTEKNREVRELFESNGVKREGIEKMLATINDQFLADVRAARPNVKDDSLRGAVYFAAEAKDRALIDDIVSLDETIPLLADMAQANQKSTHTMNILAELKQLIGKADQEESSATETNTAQAELDQARADLASAQAELETTRQTLADTQAQLETTRQTLADTQAQLTTVTADRDSWKQKAETYGKQPGEKPTVVSAEADDVDKGEQMDWRAIIDSLPSERAAAEAGY